jgi:hypothetical protein
MPAKKRKADDLAAKNAKKVKAALAGANEKGAADGQKKEEEVNAKKEQAKAPARFVSSIRFVQACLSVCGLCAVDIRTVFVVHWRSRRTAQICPSSSSWQQCTP